MHKHIDHWPHRSWEPPFVGLVTPTFEVAEAIVSVFASLRDFIVREYEAWRRRRLMARTIAELSGLDDHVLRDIGVPREDIHAVALGAVEGGKSRFDYVKAY